MKSNILILFVCIVSSSYSQTFEYQLPQPKDSAYTVKFNKLKELYVKQYNSESYKKMKNLNDAFMDKVNPDHTFLDFKGVPPIDWVKGNLEKTAFSSYDDAKKEYAEIEKAAVFVAAENGALTNMILELVKNKEHEIMTDVLMELMHAQYGM